MYFVLASRCTENSLSSWMGLVSCWTAWATAVQTAVILPALSEVGVTGSISGVLGCFYFLCLHPSNWKGTIGIIV